MQTSSNQSNLPSVIMGMAALPALESAAIKSHTKPPAVKHDPGNPLVQLMQMENLSATAALPFLLPRLHSAEALKAEHTRVNSITVKTEARLANVPELDRAEFLQFVRFTGLDLLTVFQGLQQKFDRRILTFLDLGGAPGTLCASIETCVSGAKGVIVEGSFATDLTKPAKDIRAVRPERIINCDIFNLASSLPEGCADLIISRNTLDLFAVPDPKLLDSLNWALRPGGCFVIDLNTYDHHESRDRKIGMITPKQASQSDGFWNYGDLTWQFINSMHCRLIMFGFKNDFA